MYGHAQDINSRFVLVGTFGSFSTVNDSTYRGDITFESDQLGQGYVPTSISAGYYVIDGVGRRYRVSVVNSSTLADANVDVVELYDYNFAPSGMGWVYNPLDNYDFIPSPPENSTGISAVSLSKSLIHNQYLVDSLLNGLGGNGDSITAHRADIDQNTTDIGTNADTLAVHRTDIDNNTAAINALGSGSSTDNNLSDTYMPIYNSGTDSWENSSFRNPNSIQTYFEKDPGSASLLYLNVNSAVNGSVPALAFAEDEIAAYFWQYIYWIGRNQYE